jgi:hypothetical protein
MAVDASLFSLRLAGSGIAREGRTGDQRKGGRQRKNRELVHRATSSVVKERLVGGQALDQWSSPARMSRSTYTGEPTARPVRGEPFRTLAPSLGSQYFCDKQMIASGMIDRLFVNIEQ